MAAGAPLLPTSFVAALINVSTAQTRFAAFAREGLYQQVLARGQAAQAFALKQGNYEPYATAIGRRSTILNPTTTI